MMNIDKDLVKEREGNLKRTARMKVKAGVRLPMAEASVGELKLIPLKPIIWEVLLSDHNRQKFIFFLLEI